MEGIDVVGLALSEGCTAWCSQAKLEAGNPWRGDARVLATVDGGKFITIIIKMAQATSGI